MGGSYNNSTNTGTAVNLQNVYLNSYDIDGNGTAGTNQFNEYNGFSSYSLGTGTTLGVSFNSTSRLTRFLSSISTNVSVVTDQTTRIRLAFNTISSLDVVVGAQGTGPAYFFLDFSIGTAVWTPTTVTTPGLDINTTTTGTGNTGATCTSATNVTSGATNYTGSANAINEVRTTFTSAAIADGNNETLVVNGSTSPANAAIALGFTGASSSTFVLSGATFRAQTSVSAGVSTIVFTNNAGGTLTTTQTEALMDALQYKHNSVTPTNGNRNFSFEIQDGALLSNPVTYTANVGCSSLPVTLLSFNGRVNGSAADLVWSTSFEQDNAFFEVEKSSDAVYFKPVGRVPATIQPQSINNYRYTDYNLLQGITYYRLKQVDKSGTFTYSSVVKVNGASYSEITMQTHGSSGMLHIYVPSTISVPVQLFIYDGAGRLVIREQLTQAVNKINTARLAAGAVYTVAVRSSNRLLYSNRFIN